ncbi:MAG: cadherin-like domain-containing protein, partial [Candidatus Krumholzibacteria bacterium]|nr:cadherin-like domain-containing protein [Candidatus Krumholzibacteria bacterium]
GGLDSPVFLTFAPVQSVTVTPGAAPTVAAGIPDTVVAEDNGPIGDYRDLNDVFFDAEDGGALEFAIVSNSNPSLITATIDADSALDLSLSPDSSGTATIVVRAADLSAQYATETFAVTVTSVADDPVAEDDPGIYSDVVLSMNPLSYWRLGEGAGTAAADFGSIANDGTYSSVVLGTTGAITGDANTAPRFDGASSYVEIPHDDAYLLDQGSLQLWFRFNANPAAREALYSKDANGFVTGGHFSVFVRSDGSLDIRLQSATGDSNLNSNSLSTSQWHHIVVTFGSRGMELFVDGNLVGTDPYNGGLGTTSGGIGNYEPATIGANTWGSNTGSIFPLGEHFDGVVDEVAIFDSQLTLSQVRALRRAGIDHYQTDEETALIVSAVDGVLANDYDIDGDPLTAVHVAGPANEQSFTLNPDGSFSYTPAVDFIGTDTFTYQADDGTARSDTATVSIVVVDVNDPPRVIAALPDTAVAMDSAPIDNYRDLNDVFSDDEDGGALTFAVQDNSNPSLVTAAIDADSALDLSTAPGQGGFASLVIRATDSGALAVEDTMLIYVSAGVTVTAEPLAAQTIHAGGAPTPMFSVAIANVSALAETLTAVLFTNTTSGPGTQTELDNEFSPLTMTAQGG